MTRIEAAERAVVEAAMEWARLLAQPIPGDPSLEREGWDAVDEQERRMSEVCARLRALRAEMEERAPKCGCGFLGTATVHSGFGLAAIVLQRNVEAACALPANHDGDHCGDLGEWRWR